MRCTLLASILLCCAIATGIRASARPEPLATRPAAAPPPVVRIEAKTEKEPLWSVTELGVGETRKEAEDVALERARGQMVTYLAGLQPPVDYVPSLDYVRSHGKRLREEPVPAGQTAPGVKYRVEVRVDLTAEDQHKLLDLDRQQRRDHRLLFLGKLLAVLVAIFAAVAGYLRLDEATRGSYSRWLRLAAVGFVGAIGAGLWLLPCLRDRLTN